MSRITRIDIPSAEGTINDLDALLDDFADAVAEIKREAARLDGCWGNDDGGRAFAGTYVDKAAELLAGSAGSVADLRKVEDFLRGAVRMFQQLDTDAGEVLEFEDKAN